MEVIISAMRLAAKDIVSLELVSATGEALPAFEAGSHIDVHLPNGLIRQYSLWNSPEERSRYCIGVLKDPASRGGSRAVHEDLRVGQIVRISEPRNLFKLDEGASRSLLFAGGIGITPILCMAQRLAQQGKNFELHYSSRAAERAAFVKRLEQSAFAQQVHFHFDDGAADQKLDLASILEKEGEHTHLYVCGPTGFMDYVLGSARTADWQEERLHREYFAAVPAMKADDGSFEVRIQSSGQVLQIPADKTVVQVLDAAGIMVPVSCEQGICGTCVTRVIDGEPDHRDYFLTPAEQAKNDQFTPCCSRAKSACLVLDL
ncbi:PDR/VanB family oxidoreductase [Pseudomonas sp. BN515]|uniref:PDR/VanB family oxidoreductase n=1 Tax=Pseudomonas sp. BN515 TaxID=2567892 RepID=UPI00245665B5|nr:PDR/VanB family oxidoreductase [Pseudomonas sp. BN515]MDH4874461.1 oxidoreductase [Pseudomonas sp. BN515]